MRTLKLAIIILIAICLMVVMTANMTPVNLHLLPERFAPGLPTLQSVPLALIIVVVLVAGIIVGMLMELLRESKFRRRLDEKRREVSTLRDENAKLAQRLAQHGDEVGALPG